MLYISKASEPLVQDNRNANLNPWFLVYPPYDEPSEREKRTLNLNGEPILEEIVSTGLILSSDSLSLTQGGGGGGSKQTERKKWNGDLNSQKEKKKLSPGTKVTLHITHTHTSVHICICRDI